MKKKNIDGYQPDSNPSTPPPRPNKKNPEQAPIVADTWLATLAKRFKDKDPELYDQTLAFFNELKEQNKKLWLENYELQGTAERWKKIGMEMGEAHDKIRAELRYYQEKSSN